MLARNLPDWLRAGRNSLRRHLLARLLPAMVLLIGAGAATVYLIALNSASRAYDRALFDTALAIAEQVKLINQNLSLNLPTAAQQILLTDKYDRVFFEVIDRFGEHVAGHQGIPPPPPPRLEVGQRVFYDGYFAAEKVRITALYSDEEDREFTVLVAETQAKRNILVREILLGMLLPEGLLVIATLTLVWLGIRSGLAPLEDLRKEISRRSHVDLSAVDARPVPEEIQPVVEEINRLLGRLGGSLEAQRHFVSDAAHQLRTPIAALQAQVEVALREPDQAAQARQLQSIRTASNRLGHVVHQLLALARAEPTATLAATALDLQDVVRENAEFWLPQALRKGLDLGFELAPAPLSGSPTLLGELLSNLIDNAIRYTPAPGTITVRCGVLPPRSPSPGTPGPMGSGKAPIAASPKPGVWLEVEDSGPGIPEADRETIFQRFRRLPGSGGDGCGLGLAIVREIARQHGGDARISTGPEGGALFRIELPGGGPGSVPGSGASQPRNDRPQTP